MRLSFGEHFTCGGFDPTPWLAIGLLMTGTGLVSYRAFRRIRGAAATRPRLADGTRAMTARPAP
jgi:hypothetical protein